MHFGAMHFGAMDLGDRGGGDRRPELKNSDVIGLPNEAATAASGFGLGERRHLVLQPFETSRASAAPTTSGRVARNWPSLT